MSLLTFHRLTKLLVLFLIACSGNFLVFAQEEPSAVPASKSIIALEAILPLIKSEQKELDGLTTRLKEAKTTTEKAKLEAEIGEKTAQIKELRENFRVIAAGPEEGAYFNEPTGDVSLNQEFQEILKPLIHELRDATSAPREMEELREALQRSRDRVSYANAALKRLESFLNDESLSTQLKEEIEQTKELWLKRQANSEGQISVLEAKLEEKELNSPTFFEAAADGLAGFWKSRGLNLLIAIVAFIVTLIGLRRLYGVIRRYSPFRRSGELRFTSRLVDLTAGFLAILGAATASLIVFYLRGDWLLLTISAIILAAIVIASRNSLPPYIGQIRTVLNLGPVREGERLVHEGIPWRVDRLGLYCYFSNPLLEGGTVRLPIQVVGELYSRPCDRKEAWFPTKEGDWVILSDDTFGKVVQQTPERVTLVRLGGSRKIYPTTDFLSLSPENLSTGFRITSVFGIDYSHQAICTETAPGIFAEFIEKDLIEHFGKDVVKNLNVEFRQANASSLDYAVLADFTGEAAPRYNALERRLQKLCVDVCNLEGWTIPFTQITLHQAVSGNSVDAPVDGP